MILKYDIYFKVHEDILDLYELVPQKKRFRIHIGKSSSNAVNQLMTLLTRGIDGKELTEQLEQMPAICQQIVDFLQEKRNFSSLDMKKIANDPFRRQLEVFDSWNRSSKEPEEYQRKLSDACVLIIGAGGVGSALAHHLTSCGVGTIYCMDFDTIEVHNLPRQSSYNYEDIGKPKAEALSYNLNKRGLNKVYPINNRLTKDNLDTVINQIINQQGKIDLVTGRPIPTSSGRREIIAGFLKRNIPVLCLGEHDVGPFVFTEYSFECYDQHMVQHFELGELYYNKRDIIGEEGIWHPSFAPTIQQVCAVAADEIVRFLNQYAPVRTTNGCFIFDPITGNVKLHKIQGS